MNKLEGFLIILTSVCVIVASGIHFVVNESQVSVTVELTEQRKTLCREFGLAQGIDVNYVAANRFVCARYCEKIDGSGERWELKRINNRLYLENKDKGKIYDGA